MFNCSVRKIIFRFSYVCVLLDNAANTRGTISNFYSKFEQNVILSDIISSARHG